MKLKSFRVRNFRSVNDSGLIEVRDRTALVGRNESGKTNLLLALASLNPPDGMPEMTFVKDFPRDRMRDEFSQDTKFLESTWELSDKEKRELAGIFPRAKEVCEVIIGRRYHRRNRRVNFEKLPHLAVDTNVVNNNLTGLRRSANASLRGKNAEDSGTIKEALGALAHTLGNVDAPVEWADSADDAIESFRGAISVVDPNIFEKNGERIATIQAHARDIRRDNEAWQEARNWAVGKLPTFVYLSEYAEIEGHQDIAAFLQRQAQGTSTESDENFVKLVKVAGLDPTEMNTLLSQNHEERQQLANRASAVVTRKIRELWTERQLSVRFNLDERHFDTIISDPNAVYPVDVNLDERSRGFKWFFSFYMTFAADTAGGPAEDAILLLDEPGLYLHAMAQRNLLDLFKNDFDNQILYTTHSPFMIPTEELASGRTVNIAQDEGTTVTNDPTGDSMTLFPLQAALGYDITQTLFVGQQNLVVEGVSDYWYLSTISEYLTEQQQGPGLPSGMVITPAGGAQKVSYMVALLASQNMKVIVLFDDEPQAKNAAEDLLKSKLIRDEHLVFVADGFTDSPTGGADIEDLLDPEAFRRLVEVSYARELEGKDLVLNDHIPRVVKRYEEAFRALGMTFHKTRPAKLFLRKMAEAPAEVLSDASVERFKRLFGVINERSERAARRETRPFM